MFTENIYDSISVQRDNIVIDGADYTIQGSGMGTGVDLANRRNVTVKNMVIRFFDPGINMDQSEDNRITNNTIANSVHHSFGGYAISMYPTSRYNVISNNTIINNERGIELLEYCNYNTIAYNFINNTYGWYGIAIFYSHGNRILNNVVMFSDSSGICLGGSAYVYGSRDNIIAGNTVTNNTGSGIYVNARWGGTSKNNTIIGNNVAYNGYNGVSMGDGASQNKIIANNIKYNSLYGINVEASGNVIYHNNITNNGAFVKAGYTAIWDNGYPSGGNYWDSYSGVDIYSGPYQNETGSDGIGDSPYIIDADNEDRYPLMSPYSLIHDIAIINMAPSQNVVTQGSTFAINAKAKNNGDFTETFNVTISYNSTPIETQTVINLVPIAEMALTFNWNTTGIPLGTHTLSAEAGIVPGETNTTDNIIIDGEVEIIVIVQTSIHIECNDYPISIESNSTITMVSATKHTLEFETSGPNGTVGYVNITIPVSLNKTVIKVFIDANELTPPPFPIITTNGTNYFIYFEFTQSDHDITI